MPEQTPEQRQAALTAAGLNPGQQEAVKAGVQFKDPASPTLLVTSGDSRTKYADNVTKLGSITSNLTSGTQTQEKTSTTPQGGSTSPSITINSGPSTVDQPKMYTYKLPNGDNIQIGDPTINRSILAGATYVSGGDGKDPLLQNTTSSSTSESSKTVTDGLEIPETIKTQYKETLASIDEAHKIAQDVLAQATATLQNDPAALAAAKAISDKYEILIRNTQTKNRLLLGGYSANAARTGALQYANDMTSTFMSEQMDKANQRISDLIAQEQSLILQSNNAYKTGNIKAFNEAMSALEKTNTDKINALDKLLSASTAQVKTVQAQEKTEAAERTASIKNDQILSTQNARYLAEQIINSGVTDQATIDSYLETMAETYGIKNVDTLKSVISKEQDAIAKADLANKNTQSIIKKRETPKAVTGGGSGGTSTTKEKNSVIANITKRFGSQDKDDAGYVVRGADNYVDPYEYINAYKQWITKYPDKEFVTKFPPKDLINPSSYSLLPAAIRPAPKKVAA